MRRRALAFVVVLIASASTAATANAAIAFKPCPTSTLQCARVPVPLDPSGATPGTITLTVERKVAPSNPAKTAIVALAGGPGQAAVPLAEDLAGLLKSGLSHRDLIVFDQRGTGSSNALRCSALDLSNPHTLTELIADESKCATQIGSKRAFFTTAQSVADIEALRVAGGYNKLIVFGVSYGTKVAEEYAQTYPDNVSGLILDSVVTPTGPDAFNQTTFTAIPRVLRDLCADGACRGITAQVSADLKAVLLRTAIHPVHSVVVDGHGTRIPFTFDSQDIFNVLLAGDLNPAFRSLMPAALRGAHKGDDAPLARVIAHAEGLNEIEGLALEEVPEDNALFYDTTCEESLLPWPRTVTNPAQRRVLAKNAVAALPSSSFAPFSRKDVLDGQSITFCLGWPQASPAPPTLGPLPTVPTLVLEGQADLRTTVADAKSVADQIPGSTLVVVPHDGHSVLGTDPSGCATKALREYFAGITPHQCPATTPNHYPPVGTAPTKLADLPGHGRELKTVAAAAETIVDQYHLFVADAIQAEHIVHFGSRVGGLRGGFSRLTAKGIELHSVSYLPGLTVTGTISARTLSGTVTIAGPAGAPGTIHFAPNGAVTGSLGGHTVSAHPAQARAARAGTTPASSPLWGFGHLPRLLVR